MHGQCLVAVYPSRNDAEKAFRAAVGSGIPSDSVQISRAAKPVWEWLFSKRVSEKDKKHYRSRLPDGETAVSVMLDGASSEKIDAIEGLLDLYDPLDVHIEGDLKSAEASAAPLGESHAAAEEAESGGHHDAKAHDEKPPMTKEHTEEPMKAAAPTEPMKEHMKAAAPAREHEEVREEKAQVIPLPEEELNVSAQTSDRVRRIRTYVVEEPVDKEVSLSDERMIVERRPATSNEAGEPMERIYEVHERHDEPLISKTMKLDEELVVRKEATQHTERVHGIVRRTKAEIEKDLGAQLSPPKDPRGR